MGGYNTILGSTCASCTRAAARVCVCVCLCLCLCVFVHLCLRHASPEELRPQLVKRSAHDPGALRCGLCLNRLLLLLLRSAQRLGGSLLRGIAAGSHIRVADSAALVSLCLSVSLCVCICACAGVASADVTADVCAFVFASARASARLSLAAGADCWS